MQSPVKFYTWRNYQCAYEIHQPINSPGDRLPLLLIHPIGVGLSRRFWHRFCDRWYQTNHHHPIYNPDLLGCGDSDMPRIAYQPKDWADQLQFFLETVVQKPVILVVQGALSPVALELLPLSGNLIAGVIFSGPTSWNVTTKNAPRWQQKLLWNLFNSPLGNAFFRYARTRKFLTSFSTDKLFAAADSIDEEWLNTCMTDAQNIAGRYAVFSFLARFWQKDYTQAIAAIQQPTLIVVGDTASSISQAGRSETPDQRLTKYLTYLQKGEGIKVAGRNVLPYESTAQFIAGISPFIAKIS